MVKTVFKPVSPIFAYTEGKVIPFHNSNYEIVKTIFG